ncbi:hypothetical protein KR074_008380 [Drosophila pseudoananassae]|nr:hypothetical protein KR074_008380 [Drosophila pseudoananassae]
MDCRAVMRLSYKWRCRMATQAEDCKRIVNFFNYFRMMYCTIDIDDKWTEIGFMMLFVFLCGVILWIMSFNIDFFFSPALKIVSLKLHMNEYLAGITFLAFGNSCPDIFANLMPVRAEAPIFTIAVGNALAIILLSGGTVCFLKPFQMNGHCVVRDLLFLMLGVEIVRYFMVKGGVVTKWNSIVLVAVYVVYVLVNVIDVLLMRREMKKLRVELEEMEKSTSTPSREYVKKLSLLRSMEEDDDIRINDTSNDRRSLGRRISDLTNTGYFITPKPEDRPETVDYEANRTNLHNTENPKNLMLFQEFLYSLNPIDREEWLLGGKCRRAFLIVRSPIVFILLFFIPVVDYEKDKHGWSKLLNCIQIVTNPFVVITLVHSAIMSQYTGWYILLHYKISMWSPCVTVPLAVLIFLHSRTDVPPVYHLFFILLTFWSSVVTIWIAVAELEVLSDIVGIVFNLSENFMSVTIGAISNATPDIIANSHLAMQGYGRMAFAAIIGGPVFAVVISISVAFLFNNRLRHEDAAAWVYGEHGENCYIFLLIAIVTTLWWSITFNFQGRRSAGVFLWTIFLIFLIYAACVEWELVHDFSKDPMFKPK